MPSKYIRMIGFCLLGGGAALAFGSINHLFRMSEMAERYREVLAPHLATVPDGSVYSGSAEEVNHMFTIQIPRSETFELKFLQVSSNGGADAGTTRVFAIGGMIMMALGMGLASNTACTSGKKEEAEQAAP